jgi:hypothetical protein
VRRARPVIVGVIMVMRVIVPTVAVVMPVAVVVPVRVIVRVIVPAVGVVVRVVMSRVMVMRVIVPTVPVLMLMLMLMTGLVPGVEGVDTPAMALVVMGMVHMTMAIGPGLRLKAFGDVLDRSAEPLDHGAKHMIRQQPQPAPAHLHRHMPVADMVGDAGQLGRTARTHFHQGLGGRLDGHHPTVLEVQSIAMAQQAAVGKIDADLFAAQQLRAKSRALALLKTQFEDFVHGGITAGALSGHLEGHDWSSGDQTRYQNRK